MTNDEIIREEIESILQDIKKEYESSGKRTTGEFLEGLEAVYLPNQGTIKGFVYLSGRKAGKMPPVQNILKWINAKGIRPIEENVSASSLAWAIAKKIAKEGTKPENHLNIYERVITPKRINDIIERISQLNVNRLITEIQAELTVLAKGV